MGESSDGARRVLIADDERDILDLVRIVLERAGYEVVTAFGGRRALELARERPPALCILDGTMPDLTGFEVLAGLRGEGTTADVPVLVLTATVNEEREMRRHGVQPNAFMRKPFGNARLLREVARLIG